MSRVTGDDVVDFLTMGGPTTDSALQTWVAKNDFKMSEVLPIIRALAVRKSGDYAEKTVALLQRQGKHKKGHKMKVDPKELKLGIDEEMEHTQDERVAKEIALDHLHEDPRYYTNLKKMGDSHVTKSVMMKASDLAKAKYTKRTGTPGNYRYEYGEPSEKKGGKDWGDTEGFRAALAANNIKRPKKDATLARRLKENKERAAGGIADDPKKLYSRIMQAASVLSSAGKEALGPRSGWAFDPENNRIVTATGYALQWKPNDSSIGGVSVTKVEKSREDFMEATGLALVLIPGELTKAAKLSNVGAAHPAGLSGVSGKTKSGIPYTGHEERMKLAKMAGDRMLGRGAVAPEDEGDHTGNPTVDRKGRTAGEKDPYTGYATGVSGMGSRATDMFGKQTFVVKPSQIGSSVPEKATKHTPVKNVRKPKK